MSPATGGTRVTPSAIAPPAPAPCLKPPLKTATTPARPSAAQSTDGPASSGAAAHLTGSLSPTCQRRSVERARSRSTRKRAEPSTTVVVSTITPRADADTTAQPGWGRSRGTVVEVVDVDVVVVGDGRSCAASTAARAAPATRMVAARTEPARGRAPATA